MRQGAAKAAALVLEYSLGVCFSAKHRAIGVVRQAIFLERTQVLQRKVEGYCLRVQAGTSVAVWLQNAVLPVTVFSQIKTCYTIWLN